ncbi:MAG: PhzF family phenazine biosynthesis protein [Clostridia bacterium]|nr:PhzF family phenazine biosynthesis protein [Clostridia bacterium]
MSEKSRRYTAAVVDAFTNAPYSGNPAGVIILGGDPFPEDDRCIRAAAELRFSETAFVRQLGPTEFAVRYFTPVCEASLCGHATVASFTFLREKRLCGTGDMLVHTASGDIRVTVSKDGVWLDMAEAVTLKKLLGEEAKEVYRAFGLPERELEGGLSPAIVSVGLTDILLPVKDTAELAAAIQDENAVSELSRRRGVTGVHMFSLSSDGFAAHCRNFAPLYGIPEECATGTSNGALFHYLIEEGCIAPSPASFLQGEAMGRPSVIRAMREGSRIRVGGNAAAVMTGTIEV